MRRALLLELDDQIVDDRRESRIANERETKGVSLIVAVKSLAQRDDLVRSKRVEDAGYRIEPEG